MRSGLREKVSAVGWMDWIEISSSFLIFDHFPLPFPLPCPPRPPPPSRPPSPPEKIDKDIFRYSLRCGCGKYNQMTKLKKMGRLEEKKKVKVQKKKTPRIFQGPFLFPSHPTETLPITAPFPQKPDTKLSSPIPPHPQPQYSAASPSPAAVTFASAI